MSDFHHWSYRIVYHDRPDPEFPSGMTFETWYAIHEVHFAEDGSITAWTANPCQIDGATVSEMRGALMQMREAFRVPPIIASEVEAQWEANRKARGEQP